MRLLVTLAVALLLSSSAQGADSDLMWGASKDSALSSDLATVPGATNPAVTQANIKTTICVAGWSERARPLLSYTSPIKRQLMKLAGVPLSQSKNYELDHDISIEIGGSPTDLKNLWLQSYVTKPWNAHVKDKLEDRLHTLVCSGKITLEEAQRSISSNWIDAYHKYVGATP